MNEASALAEAIERFLAPQRCTTPEGVGGSQPGVHCAACCMGTGWSEPTTMNELDAARKLDAALTALRRAAAADDSTRERQDAPDSAANAQDSPT